MSVVNLGYVHQAQIGYGRLGIELRRALEQQGVTVYDWLPSPGRYDPDELNADRRPGISNLAVWVTTPHHPDGWWAGQHAALFTMWEMTELPERMRQLDAFDTVLVPSLQNVELFSQYHGNVRYVPLGIDPDVWHYQLRSEPTDEFYFMVAGSGPRKGVDLAVRAFLDLYGEDGSWGSGPVPKLIIKSPKPYAAYHERIMRVHGKVPAHEEVDLYATAHCFLAPSRGEGFGLQPLQAIAQGCPTILTGAHGHLAYSHLGIPIDARHVPAGETFHGDAGDWWEPDYDQLRAEMRQVYDDYPSAVLYAQMGASIAHRHHRWEDTARTFLEQFHPEFFTEYERPFVWRYHDRELVTVRVTAERNFDIGNGRMVLEPGVDYHVPWDVKRVLEAWGAVERKLVP